MSNNKPLPIWTMSLLITGNVLGVGVLALPIKTGLGGFIPATLSIVAIWAMMCFTALIIAKRIDSNRDVKNFDIPSFFRKEIGANVLVRWIVIIANLIILYGVITAYLSMIGTMIHSLFPHLLSSKSLIIIYFIILMIMICFGMRLLRAGNSFVIFAIWISFIFLIIYASKPFNLNYLSYTDWKMLPFGLPVIVSAFHFHNIVPTVCRQLDFNYKMIRRAIIQGTLIGLLINLIWVTLVLGDLPVHGMNHLSIAYAAAHGEPATVPLAYDLNSHPFVVFSMIFALLSVTASYMANGTGLVAFIRDLVTTYLKTNNRYLVWALAFTPPLIIALIDPSIFLQAINIVGGVGEVILFGILPAIVLLKAIYKKQGKESRKKLLLGYATLIISGFTLIIALMQQF